MKECPERQRRNGILFFFLFEVQERKTGNRIFCAAKRKTNSNCMRLIFASRQCICQPGRSIAIAVFGLGTDSPAQKISYIRD